LFYFTTLSALLFLALASSSLASQEDAPQGELLSRYWLEEPVTLAATIGLPNHLFSVSVDDKSSGSDKQKNVDYSPPQATDLTLLAGYGFFHFAWRFALPQSASSKSAFGKASYDDFSLEFGRERVAASLYYQRFGGFFTDLNGNTDNYSRIGGGATNEPASSTSAAASAPPQDILKRPDISTKHYGAIAWYAVPVRGEGAQAFQIALGSLAGRPDPGFNLNLISNVFYDYAQIYGTLPFVPEKKAAVFGHGASLQGVDMHSLGAGVGMATSYVFESTRFFLDGLLTYGGGAQRQHTVFADDSAWSTVYVDNVNMKMGLNYRNDRQRAGLHFWVNDISSRVRDVRINSSNMAVELGYQHTI
jgi:hypothetical protein